ncbi:MAG: dephospho-CoA kinase [Alphaproteobacteria bacterium]|nr:dephospho-CoA kinase [Alphaproteobacteria bacterium]
MRTFGLTGGIATGKSTVARLLRERHGIPVIDADQVARAVVAPGSPGLAEVVEAFGPDVLEDDGRLDRPAMRALIMADPAARRRLEAITHPRIAQGVGEALAALASQGTPLAAVEAALMVESGSWRMYDALVVVSASPETQLARVVDRDGGTRDDAARILAAQLPLADKERVASYVVHNEGSRADLEAEVDRLVAWLRAGPGAAAGA